MESKLLQIAVAVAGCAGLVLVPLLWVWQQHVAALAQRSAVT